MTGLFTTFAAIGLSLSPFVLAQMPLEGELLKIAAQSGFNAVLVLILLWFSFREREKFRKTLDLLTRAVTQVTLGLAFLPQKFHDDAKDVQRALDEEKNK